MPRGADRPRYVERTPANARTDRHWVVSVWCDALVLRWIVVKVGLLSLLVCILMFVLLIALHQDYLVVRTFCLVTIAFVVGLDMIPLVQLAYELDPT